LGAIPREGVEQGVAVDEVILEGQQPEQEIVIGGAGHGVIRLRVGGCDCACGARSIVSE
jgi:hypothetical protein